MKRLIKKIIRILLILMVSMSLLTACTYKVYASSAAGVIVAGGSIGTGGASVGLLGMLGPVAAIVGVALASYGIYVVLDEAAQESGQTKTDFIYEKITEYNEQRNLSDSAMQDLILEGASVLKNGAISISSSASAYINGFINYMYGSNDIADPDSLNGVPSHIVYGGVELPVFTPYQIIPIQKLKNFHFTDQYGTARNYAACRCRDVNGNMYLYFLSNVAGNCFYSSSTEYGSTAMWPVKDGVYRVTFSDYQYDSLPASSKIIPDLTKQFRTFDRFINQAGGSISFEGEEPVSSLYGDQSVFNDRAGTLSPSAGENTVFTPPLVGGVSGSGTISVPDYLDAINSLLNTGAADVPIADPVTGVESMVTVTDIDITDTVPDLDTVEEQETIGSTVVVDPDLPITPDQDTVNSLAFDLREIFPFCIPFDIYNLLSKFVADPVAPHWDISIPLPLNMPAIEFEIDLSDFEPVGVVLRSFEMVLFVTSLAVATRSIYLRG